jgi:hypothetical protein
VGEADRCRDGRVSLCCAIGATGWLGTSWAREKASREEAGVAGGSWGWLGMARDSEKESRQ